MDATLSPQAESRKGIMEEMPKDGTEAGVRSLITAAEMYPALEAMVLGAEREVLLSFRVFDHDTKTHSDEARARGFRTWRDILADVAGRGVDVRLLLTDFDPVYAVELHMNSWRSAEAFVAAEPRISVRLALHGMQVGAFWRLAFHFKTRGRRRKALEKADHETPALRQVRAGKFGLYPVTLHQKMAVVDGRRAIIGGLDVDNRRFDTPDHERLAPETWHDVSLHVTGPVVDQIRAHFVDTWRLAAEDGAPTLGADPEPLLAKAPDGVVKGQRLLRTVSRPKDGIFAFAPRTVLNEHEEAHLKLFEGAERFIYLENQFFRHRPLAQALARAAERRPDLQLILILPAEPERILFGGDRGFDARHEQALQLRAIEIVQKAFGDRLALIAPAKPHKATGGDKRPLFGAGVVYVHAKVTNVDDRHLIVGSANLNGRSMRWDTEASIYAEDPAAAREIRLRLARRWLGREMDASTAHLARTWNRSAEDNAKTHPDHRDNFVLPYPIRRARRFSAWSPFLPDDMF